MSVAVRKLDGVESVDVSLNKATADIRLKPNNHVTLAQLRSAIKNNGYATRDAMVDARGRIHVNGGGKVALDLLNGSALLLERIPSGASPEQIVELRAVVKSGADVLNDVKLR